MEGYVRHELLKYQKHVLGKSLKSLNITYILLGEYIKCQTQLNIILVNMV